MLVKFKNFLQDYLYLIPIVIVAVILRFYNLSDSPPSLNWDEVSHGYNAYSILKTGYDEWGNFMPLIFRAYGDYKLPVYIYLTVVSEVFFGLTPFAVRFISALAGVGTVIFTYLLVKEMVKKQKSVNNHQPLAIISSLLVAIEPWSVFVSRAALEANLALFFFVFGMYFFFKFLNSPTSYFLFPTSVFLGLTVWTYNSYRIFTLLMIGALVLIYWKDLANIYQKSRLTVNGSLFLLLLFFVPMLFQLFSSVGQARYSFVQILDEGTIARIEQKRNEGGNILLHNRPVYFFTEFSKNYLTHFSPIFLFFEGGDNYQFNVPGMGILNWVNAVFFYFGIVLIAWKVLRFKNENIISRRNWTLLLIWLALAPFPSSLTREAPHVLRAITFLPMPMVLTAVGIHEAFRLFKGLKIIYFLLPTSYFFLLTMLSINYLRYYFVDYRLNYSASWQYGYKQVSEYINDKYSSYDKIIITKKYGEPHEFLLFYLKYDPTSYLSNSNLNRFYQSNWYWVDSFDKFYFVNDWEISENNDSNIPRSIPEKDIFKLESGDKVDCYSSNSKCLLVTSQNNHPSGWNKLETINFLDSKPAFEIYEN